MKVFNLKAKLSTGTDLLDACLATNKEQAVQIFAGRLTQDEVERGTAKVWGIEEVYALVSERGFDGAGDEQGGDASL